MNSRDRANDSVNLPAQCRLVMQQGFRFESRGPIPVFGRNDDQFAKLTIWVMEDDREIGVADFSNGNLNPHCQHVHVDEKYRKRGIATAIYMLAEHIFDKSLWNFWHGNEYQSDAARSMWANPNRPFGRRPVEE